MKVVETVRGIIKAGIPILVAVKVDRDGPPYAAGHGTGPEQVALLCTLIYEMARRATNPHDLLRTVRHATDMIEGLLIDGTAS